METAVEEFLNAIKDQIPLSNEHLEMIESYALQCKEMEKENTINFAIQYMFGRTDIGSNLRNDFIQKYNETFKSE
jgi:hypothetical protein